MSAAVLAADVDAESCTSDISVHWRGEGANLAGPVPARHQILVELHELLHRSEGLVLAGQIENRIAPNHLFGLDERTVDDAQLAVHEADLRAGREWHQPATVDHTAGFDLPLGKLAHRLEQLGCRWSGMI